MLAAIVLITIAFFIHLLRLSKMRQAERKKASLKQQIVMAEMKALRSQMNPHFIFNCMNTIDAFILQNETGKATSFLNKFARLIRNVLENSQYPFIDLEEELQNLRLYLHLENVRFNHDFDYKIIVNEETLKYGFRIPPLLLQPYVENAIIHGLRHQTRGQKSLQLLVTRMGKGLNITITDSGIGRSAAAAIDKQLSPLHQPMGLKVAQDRLQMLKDIYDICG